MIKKEDLLNKINELIELERLSLPLLNKDIASSLYLGGLKDDDYANLVEWLRETAITSTKHTHLLSEIKIEIENGKSNVY